MEMTYTEVDGYFYPGLTLPDAEEHRPLGKYGLLWKTYLKRHRPMMYDRLLLVGKLDVHLRKIRSAFHLMKIVVIHLALVVAAQLDQIPICLPHALDDKAVFVLILNHEVWPGAGLPEHIQQGVFLIDVPDTGEFRLHYIFQKGLGTVPILQDLAYHQFCFVQHNKFLQSFISFNLWHPN